MQKWYEGIEKTPHSSSIVKENGVPQTIFAMLSTIAHVQLDDNYLSVFDYYALVFPDKKEEIRVRKLEQRPIKNKVDLQQTKYLQKFAFTHFQTELLQLIQWKTHVNFEEYSEHVNKLAADARELKKMLTDIYVSQEEEIKREATGILHVQEPFKSEFLSAVAKKRKKSEQEAKLQQT